MWGTEFPLLWENLSSLWVGHPGGMGFDYESASPTHLVVVLSSCL